MSKHTPGPWRSDEGVQPGLQGKTFPGVWGGEGDLLICLLDRGTHDDGTHSGKPATDSEIWANARLIAAAPDLLAACEAVVKTLTDGHELIWQQCVAAIAKARGENGGGK